jgi:hypothetical protein
LLGVSLTGIMDNPLMTTKNKGLLRQKNILRARRASAGSSNLSCRCGSTIVLFLIIIRPYSNLIGNNMSNINPAMSRTLVISES